MLNSNTLRKVKDILKYPQEIIGDLNGIEKETWLFDNETNRIKKKCITNFGISKIFDDLLVMAMAVYDRHDGLTEIRVNIDSKSIDIMFNVNILEHLHNSMMLFGNLFSLDHANETYNLLTCNVFSQEFSIEYGTKNTKANKLIWKNNMQQFDKISLEKLEQETKTIVSIKPCFENLKMEEINLDLIALFKRRCHELAVILQKANVHFNSDMIKTKSFNDYCQLFDFKGKLLFHKVNENLEIGVALTNNNNFQQVSLVNGISTIRGGKHINFVRDQLVLSFNEILKSDKNGNRLKEKFQITKNLWIFVNCKILNATYQSINKEYMNLNPFNFEKDFELKIDFINKLKTSEVFQSIVKSKINTETKKILDIKNLFEANNLGLSQNNTLVFSRYRCSIVHGDNYGYYTLDPNELHDFHKLFRVIGLSENPETLRYKRVVFLLDDTNEKDYHLLGSLINCILNQCSSLLNSFLQYIPIVSFREIERDKAMFNELLEQRVNLVYEKSDELAIKSAFTKDKNVFDKWFGSSMLKFVNNSKAGLLNNQMSCSQFINTKVFLYYYTMRLNKTPSLVDGLTPIGQIIIHQLLEQDESTKVSDWQKDYKTIENLANDTKNNINFLMPIDNLSMLSLTPLSRTLFRKIGNSFLPIIPTVLVNGFYNEQSFVPRFNPIDVVENIKLLLNDKKTLTMKPFYKHFKGDIELTDEHMIARGVIKQFGSDSFEITELPLFTSSQWYVETVVRPMMRKNNRTGLNKIQDYRDETIDENQKKIIITMTADQIEQIPANGGVYKFFKIEKIFKLNLNCYDHNNLLCKYNNIDGIFNYFFKYTSSLLVQNGQDLKEWLNDLNSFLNKNRNFVDIKLNAFSLHDMSRPQYSPITQRMEFDERKVLKSVKNSVVDQIIDGKKIGQNVVKQITKSLKKEPSSNSKTTNQNMSSSQSTLAVSKTSLLINTPGVSSINNHTPSLVAITPEPTPQSSTKQSVLSRSSQGVLEISNSNATLTVLKTSTKSKGENKLQNRSSNFLTPVPTPPSNRAKRKLEVNINNNVDHDIGADDDVNKENNAPKKQKTNN